MKYINKLIENGLGTIIDANVKEIIENDEVYQKDMQDAATILGKFNSDLSAEQKQLLEDYIACMMSATERAYNLSYLIGAKNTIQFLQELNTLK